MIYLSRLQLNPQSRMVQRELNSPYQLHRTIMRGFTLPREAAGVLYRLEVDPHTGSAELLVQSSITPNWTPLADVGQGYYLLTPPESKAVDVDIPTGRSLRFRLRANPTIKKTRDNRHSNRVPFKREEEQLDWLAQRALPAGFAVQEAFVRDEREYTDRTGQAGETRHRFTLYTVLFEGRLQVTDAPAFAAAWQYGIGPARAFGCGLLSLASA